MSVNSNTTASGKNLKKVLDSNVFSFIAGVIDTGDQSLLTNINISIIFGQKCFSNKKKFQEFF